MVKSYVLANPDWICEGRFCLSSISGYVQHGSKIVIEIGEGGSSSRPRGIGTILKERAIKRERIIKLQE